ncbi:MAG: hypothetical protein JW720_05505 [Sedimentisphaerales bacterium]|nr:hypothetical protein [Sedimentisphaerales bacterium]
MKKQITITPADFQGIATQDFNAWKKAEIAARRNTIIFVALLAVACLVLLIAAGLIFVPGGLLFALVLILIWRKPNRLADRFGIKPATKKRTKTVIQLLGPALVMVSRRKRTILDIILGCITAFAAFVFLVNQKLLSYNNWSGSFRFHGDKPANYTAAIIGIALAAVATWRLIGRKHLTYQCLACGHSMNTEVAACPACTADLAGRV